MTTISMKKLIELTTRNDIVYAVVANMENYEVSRVGDVYGLDDTSLASNLFGDAQRIGHLFISLKGQTLPRIWRQGRVSAVVYNPSEHVVVGLFYHEDTTNPVIEYRHAKTLNMMVNDVFGESKG